LNYSEGKTYVRNTYLLHSPFKGRARRDVEFRGPAITVKEEHGNRQEDWIYAFQCPVVSEDIVKWEKRVEYDRWRCKEIQENVMKSPCFLVPVGHKRSTTPDLEYRMSTSLAERTMVFGMNITQIRCLIVLKMLTKTRRINEVLKSYFCKTALFYTIDNTSNKGWVEDNLVSCVIKCLQLLVDCLKSNHMPHYFLTCLDMLEDRFDERERTQIAYTLETVIGDCVKAIHASWTKTLQ